MVTAACLYDEKGNRFADYTREGAKIDFPDRPSSTDLILSGAGSLFSVPFF